MHVALQQLYSYNLLEAFVQITGYDTCNATHNGAITDRMVCAAARSGDIGPCGVRSL